MLANEEGAESLRVGLCKGGGVGSSGGKARRSVQHSLSTCENLLTLNIFHTNDRHASEHKENISQAFNFLREGEGGLARLAQPEMKVPFGANSN